jgi:serpin B
MKQIFFTSLFVALVFLTFGITSTHAVEQNPQTEFTFNLYRTIVKDKANENVTISPFGVQHVLDLIRFGADGDTRTEIERVLGYTQPVRWQSGTDGSLSTAAALWAQQGHSILPEFLQTARDNFGASVEQADFERNSADAVRRINAWCSEQTNGKIPTLFERLDPMTRLVLVGAIHFAADWQMPFNEHATRERDLTLLNGTTARATLMAQIGRIRHVETLDTLAIELPYKNEGYAMLLLLPKNPANFATWEAELTLEKWNTLRRTMTAGQVDVLMPRFTMESTIPLNDVLKRLGMPTAFGDDSDFSKIDGTKDLYISEALQKTFVRVDETGTEAAAVTGIAMATRAMVQRPFQFHADRPFVYAIVMEDTILFLGRFVKPE